MWISARYALAVIRTFDAVINAQSIEDLIKAKDDAEQQTRWALGELTQMERRQPKDKRTLSAIIGIASSQAYQYFRYLVEIGELEQLAIPQPDKIIYRPTPQSKTVIGQKGSTLLFSESVKKLLPMQSDWVAGGAL